MKAVHGLCLVAVCAASCLAGCATQAHAPAPTAVALPVNNEPPITAGVPLATVPAVALSLYLHAERDAILRMWGTTPHAENTSTSSIRDGILTIALTSDAWFEGNSGQFRVSALAPFSALATVLARHSAQVVWVIGRGPDAGDPYGLSERRAASAAAALERHGVAPAQLRFMTRPMKAGGIPSIDVIAVPLQSGAIAAAYVPPE